MPHDKISEDTAKCPMTLEEVDLFEPGAQKYWYESYEILHAESPVHRIPGEGTTKDKAFPDTLGSHPRKSEACNDNIGSSKQET